MELKRQVRLLKRDLESREADVTELRANSEHQIDYYNELWTAHDNLLMKTQALRSQVTILSSGG